eukprot:TRINITY_DN2900_c0_g1_i1.p1 TRINITY_DN2900_c0_g1~~TRINITY_DN2900_c0_g1_i1.p1  ORF type:complete len:286 (+),score=81.00 TRINITY_DN2900_c0_g1_i1:166-1023(+)
MVLIHVKKGTSDCFLAETTVHNENSVIRKELVDIWNLSLRLRRLGREVEQLAKFGPIKPESEFVAPGEPKLDDLSLEDSKGKEEDPTRDPTGIRIGHPAGPEHAELLMKTVEDGLRVIDPANCAKRKILTKAEVEEAISNVRGAVMIAYPGGIPSHDPVQMILEDREDLSQKQDSLDILDPETAAMWWAGKRLLSEDKLMKYVGKNEKTKIIVKLQKAESGPPVREPPIDEETQKMMLSYYYKKQEEEKAMKEDPDDVHHDSSWADPEGLRSQFQGLGNISWKPR